MKRFPHFFPTFAFLFLGLLGWVFPSAQLSAQKVYVPGYVVLNNGDTLHGRILDRNVNRGQLYERIRFRGEGGRRKFRPNQIQAYQADGALFESKWYAEESAFLKFTYLHQYGRGEKVFLRVLHKGPVSCYSLEFVYDDNNFIDSFELFLREGDTRYQRANQGLFGLKKKRLSKYFSDCPALVDLINSEAIKSAPEVARYYEEGCL